MMARSDVKGFVKGVVRPLSRLRWAADTALSRRLFGNTLKLRTNLEGFGRALWTRQGFAADVDAAVSVFYDQHQYYRPPPGTLPEGLIGRLAARFDAALRDPAQVNSAYTDEEFYRQYKLHPASSERHLLTQHVRDVHLSLPDIYELFSEPVVRLIRSCFRSNFRVQSMAAWRMFALPATLMTEPIIDRWHFDTGSTTRMRFLIPLTPMTQQNGATELWDKPYTQFLVRQGFTPVSWGDREDANRALEERYFGDPRIVRNQGPAGSAILFNPSACLHHAGRRDPGQTRDMIQLDIRFARKLQIPSAAHPLTTGY